MIAFPRYLTEQNALVVPGIVVPFPAGSLIAVRAGDMLAIASPADGTLICQWALFSQWAMADGSTFASADAAFAQLDLVCRQKRPVGSPQHTYGVAVQDRQVTIPLAPAPVDVNTVKLIVNNAIYAPPHLAADANSLTWQGEFDLAATDDVVVVYF